MSGYEWVGGNVEVSGWCVGWVGKDGRYVHVIELV